MTQPLFRTEHCLCRWITPADEQDLYEVYSDPEAMRWVGDGLPITRAQCTEWIAVTQGNYRTRGYGMFAVEEEASRQVAGFCGLVHPGGQAEVEVKYAFRRSCWGRGIASEVLAALLCYASERLGLHRVIATVAPANLASQAVLRKVGARPSELRPNEDGTFTQVFIWTAPGTEHTT